MDFISNQAPQIKEMLAILGLKNIEELFAAIPRDLILPRPIMDDGLSEYEGLCLMNGLANKNTYSQFENYLGAGAYEHHVPAIVGAICGKSEFLTSYTPYQAEASQGMLQAIFEFQSAICALTGMDVSNASVYDGASACAEAVLMSLRCRPGRNKILIAQSVHPHYRAVVNQYLKCQDCQIEYISCNEDGTLDENSYDRLIDDSTAAVLIQSPNFFGILENSQSFFDKAKQKNALCILSANPLVYGICHSAGELGADIAVGDCQPFGIPLQFGGPFAGYMACRQELIRQLPGRIVGETIDKEGRRGFVLTLQAREQHIRREKATSNICTNQALAALASLIAILWYGKEGVRELALTNYQRAAYLKHELSGLGITLMGNRACFNEFVVNFQKPVAEVQRHFRRRGIEPGLDLGRFYPELKQCLLVAVTETKSQYQLDRYIALADELVGTKRT
jgi:glycine dehydrogenase subunit 1